MVYFLPNDDTRPKMMRQFRELTQRWGALVLAAGILIAGPSFGRAVTERWLATSRTALAITGDVTFTGTRIGFQNGQSLTLIPLGQQPAFVVDDERVAAALYQVTPPADPVMAHGNHFCGTPITFIAVWHPKPIGADVSPRSLVVFSGATKPTGASGPGFCGSFSYDLAANH